jgi:hypothetical protein
MAKSKINIITHGFEISEFQKTSRKHIEILKERIRINEQYFYTIMNKKINSYE